MKSKRTIRTPENARAYLDRVAETGCLSRSAVDVGLRPGSVNKWRETDEEFEAGVQESLELYRDSLRAEIRRRGRDGYDEPLTHKGEKTGQTVKKYSDKLLELEAKRHDPTYRDRVTVDANVKGGVLVVAPIPTEEEFLRKVEAGDEGNP